MVITLLIGVITPLITGHGAHLVCCQIWIAHMVFRFVVEYVSRKAAKFQGVVSEDAVNTAGISWFT